MKFNIKINWNIIKLRVKYNKQKNKIKNYWIIINQMNNKFYDPIKALLFINPNSNKF